MPATQAVASKGKERLGHKVLHVEGTFRQADGKEAQYHFNVRRRLWPMLKFGSISDRELNDVRKKLAELQGGPETAILQKGREAADESISNPRTLRRRRLRRRLEERVADVRVEKDLAITEAISERLVDGVLATEKQHHERLAGLGDAVKVGEEAVEAARFAMYPINPHRKLATVTAREIISYPEPAARETVRYLEYWYVSPRAKGERVTLVERLFSNKLLTGIISSRREAAWFLAILDDIHTASDLGKPGSFRGKVLQTAMSLGSNFTIALARSLGKLKLLEAIGITISAEDVVDSLANAEVFNPATVESAVRRVDDQRFMLEAQTTLELLSPQSGVTEVKRREIAKGVARQLTRRRMKNIKKVVAKGDPADPKTYHAQLLDKLNTAATSIIEAGKKKK